MREICFGLRSRFNNLLAIFLLEGVNKRRAFTLLFPFFFTSGLLPSIIFFIYYYTYGVYWYPLYIAYGLIIGLLGIILFTMLTEYYTINKAYEDQGDFVKVRDIS